MLVSSRRSAWCHSCPFVDLPEPPKGALGSWEDLPSAPSSEYPPANMGAGGGAGAGGPAGSGNLPDAPSTPASGLPAAPRFSHQGALYESPKQSPRVAGASSGAAAPPAAPQGSDPNVEDDLVARMKRLQQM